MTTQSTPEEDSSFGATTKGSAWTMALAYGLLAVAHTYSIARILQVWLFPDPDPRLATHVSRIAMFWRLIIALYVALMTMNGVLAIHARWERGLGRALGGCIAWTVAVAVTQAFFFP